MKRIVLVGWWCWPFLTAARSCRRQNIEVFLLELTTAPCGWRRYSSSLVGGASLPPQCINTAEGLESIHKFTTSIKADALAALNNQLMVWLAQNRSLFEPACKLMMPSVAALEWENFKCGQIELAKLVGFEVLPSYYLWKTSDCLSVPTDCYPLVLRPDRKQGNTKPFKVNTVFSPLELRTLLTLWDADCGPLIAQPMVSLPNLIVHGARSENGDMLALHAFLVPRKFEAVTLTIKPLQFPSELEKGCRDFVAQAGITGCFHFEFLYSPSQRKAWFLEINVRLGGTTDKVTALGFDETVYLLQAYGVIDAIPAKPSLGRRIAANKRSLLKHAVRAATGQLSEVDYPPGPRYLQVIRSLRDFLLAKDSIFDWRDWRGAFWLIPVKAH